jgi:hypothetical protein
VPQSMRPTHPCCGQLRGVGAGHEGCGQQGNEGIEVPGRVNVVQLQGEQQVIVQEP